MAPHKDDDCFVCVFMTHGNPSTKGKDMIYSKNGPLILESLVAQFNAQNCPSLAGKPKLFFVQVKYTFQLYIVFTLRMFSLIPNMQDLKMVPPRQSDMVKRTWCN